MRRALVINCSAQHYNLGALKLADWLRCEGYDVTAVKGDPGMFALGYDLVCLSVIFSWHAPIARDIALRVKDDSEVWAGGPGLFALAGWWRQETGLECTRGLDARFDRHRGNYTYTFASRGCPVGCWFCIVPKLEGKEFSLDWDFQPAPVLCDNNLSALPVEFQRHIINTYAARLMPIEDANSGFEPRTFDEETFRRWSPILRGPWRFAYDDLTETEDVQRMMQILRDVSPRRKRVYVLIGNEPVAACYERARKVIEWGGEPYCQPVLPLKALSRKDYMLKYDWTPQLLSDFARYYNRPAIWRSVAIEDYEPRIGEYALQGVLP